MTINQKDNKIVSILAQNSVSGEQVKFEGDYFFSTMPMKDLINGLIPTPSAEVLEVANGLEYRDFVTVGILAKKFKGTKEFKDTWLYVHEEGVKVGRIQVFNNWSPHLVQDQKNIWLGLEYFCNENDEFWTLSDAEIINIAKDEISKLGMVDREDIIDATVIKMLKTYPSYTGTYNKLHVLQEFTESIENLYLIGRNGMHKYNNQDHSMLTAMQAVDNIINGETSKNNIWQVNTEEEYHEEKASK